MSKERPEPAGDPIQGYFREALLIGGEATRLYLIRHAQSAENTGEDLRSRDAHLTEIGAEQARRLAQRFSSQRLDLICSSPLARTRQTADAIAEAAGLPVRTVPDLAEVNLGADDGHVRDLQGKEAESVAQRILSEGTWDAFPGSEGSAPARERVGRAIDRIVEENGGKRVALVTHAAFIQTCVSVVLGVPRDFVFYPFNASIASIRAAGDRRVIWRLNDIAHLEGMPAGFGGIS
jgi:broad specificity phosphatase PhoE